MRTEAGAPQDNLWKGDGKIDFRPVPFETNPLYPEIGPMVPGSGMQLIRCDGCPRPRVRSSDSHLQDWRNLACRPSHHGHVGPFRTFESLLVAVRGQHSLELGQL